MTGLKKAAARKNVIVIGGPTASGKSGLAMAVAGRYGGIVMNADSMQVYDGLPLLTAQPSSEDMAQIPHRLYASLAPDDPCDAARWRDMALSEIAAAHGEKRIPVIVGGTGFYLKTLLKGISPIPEIPHELRSRISARQKEMGNPAFHADLARDDPAMAAKLHPFNTQRLIRAREVLEATGKSLAEWQALPLVGPPDDLDFFVITLIPPRDNLYASCNKRFMQMLDRGAVEEVAGFKEKHPVPCALDKALGYPEISAYIDGKISLDDAVTKAQQSTRHYAKRQVTWFRHQVEAGMTIENPDSEAVLEKTAALGI